jgi:hypothetical protein
MIMWIAQPISCGIHMKSEILSDHAAPGGPVPRTTPRTALTVTTHHLNQRHCRPRRDHYGARLGLSRDPAERVGMEGCCRDAIASGSMRPWQ